jgi:transcriptional regulator with GAF, ATPase, and Fis domain
MRQIQVSWASALLAGIEESSSLAVWLARPLLFLVDNVPVGYGAVYHLEQGNLVLCQDEGQRTAAIPAELARRALDENAIKAQSTWVALPIPSRSYPALVFMAQTPTACELPTQALLNDLIEGLADAIDSFHLFSQQRQRTERLTKTLEIAADWNGHRDLNRLLTAIAEAATALLNADRASIFLWDKTDRQLVGHPALGVEGKPLRIPDNQGVAGAVLKSLQSRRWDRSDPSDEVNRNVDAQSGYRTDSLVAVPLLDSKGKAMGVFEVLNHRKGRFSLDDEVALQELAKHASAALFNMQQIQHLIQVRERLTQDAAGQTPLLGNCAAIQSLRATVQRVADTDLAVLLLGENGTGKEVVSRQIHYQSRRKYETFIAVNCAALTESLLESELFGHEKGAFTDAHEARAGKFEVASGGTLLLDEIGDMSMNGQAKLLRVLEEKVVVRVGGSVPIPVDVRVLAATNQNLVDLVRQKKFREDLYFRLTVVTVRLPSLRERGDDILEIANFFMESFCRKIGRGIPEWSPSARRRLLAHSWPGNVRELRNLVERIAYLCPSDVIEDIDLDFVQSPVRESTASENIGLAGTLADATDAFQRQYIQSHIDRAKRNMTLAADNLGLQRSNLYRKMKQLGMDLPE